MPTVFIPSMMQKLTGGAQQVVVEGSSVRQVIKNLDEIHPGVKDWPLRIILLSAPIFKKGS